MITIILHRFYEKVKQKGRGKVEKICEQIVKGEKKNPRGGSFFKLLLELERADHIKL